MTALAAPPEVRFDHVSVSVADLDAQRAWYGDALGFRNLVEQVELADPPLRTAILAEPGGGRIELIERAGSAREAIHGDPLDAARGQGYGHWALRVGDVEATFAWLVSRGAEAVWPPADAVAPGARFAYVKDPEGNLIELIQPA
jgi:catechol 2,3-dioxygenase-like lactoylglutathione lyase family enzyme